MKVSFSIKYKKQYTNLYVIPAASNILFEATVLTLCACLSDIYTISFIPDWIITLAHSLHGNNPTYIVQFLTSAQFLFTIAFNSAWQTEKMIFRIFSLIETINFSYSIPTVGFYWKKLSTTLFLKAFDSHLNWIPKLRSLCVHLFLIYYLSKVQIYSFFNNTNPSLISKISITYLFKDQLLWIL